MKNEAIKSREDNLGGFHCDFGVGKDFFNKHKLKDEKLMTLRENKKILLRKRPFGRS